MNAPSPITSVRLHPHDEALLSWRFSDDWRGDCGIRSTHPSSTLEAGARVQASFIIREWGLEDDAPALQAIRRLRIVDARLRRVPLNAFRVLRAVYSPVGPYRPEILDAWKHRLDHRLSIGGVLLVTPGALEAHQASRTTTGLVDWLAGLSAQASADEPKARQTAARARRREIEALVERLTTTASAALVDAHSAWNGTGGRA